MEKFWPILSVQIDMPGQMENREFINKLQLISKLGFVGVELNICKPENIDPCRLRQVLEEQGLKMTAYATGALARREGLSLSSGHPDNRMMAVQRCREIIRFSAHMQADVILGFIKGTAGAEKKIATELLVSSLRELVAEAAANQVVLMVEATNRYEASTANTLEEAYAIIKAVGSSPWLKILPDTFHMNIEECSVPGALGKFMGSIHSIHLSDNNRYFPGFGAIDFPALFRYLSHIGYRGRMAVEGNLINGFEEDVRTSMAVLIPMLNNVSGGLQSSRMHGRADDEVIDQLTDVVQTPRLSVAHEV